MNDVIKSIKGRRSTRSYLPKQISEEELDCILEAGVWAPNGYNRQPWHFTAIQNQTVLEELELIIKSEFMSEKINDFEHSLFFNAPTVIIISAEKKGISPVESCSAAIQNILLAAESIGLATCWTGGISLITNEEVHQNINKLLKLDNNYRALYAITVGYYKRKKGFAFKRRDGVINIIR